MQWIEKIPPKIHHHRLRDTFQVDRRHRSRGTRGPTVSEELVNTKTKQKTYLWFETPCVSNPVCPA